jgi:putative hydrolase of the HAD superfamily
MRESGRRFDAKGQAQGCGDQEQIAADRLRAISFGDAWGPDDKTLKSEGECWWGLRMGIESSGNGAGINAVILDYGEVLCHRPSPQEFDRLARTFGLDENSFAPLWDKNRGAFDRGDISAEAYWIRLAEDAGAQMDAEQLQQVCEWDIQMWGNPNEEMVGWLRQLRHGGIKTALLSNIHPAMISYLQKNFAWLELFDFKTFSAEVRLIKPDRAIYEHTLRGLGVTAKESLFVDDREINVKAARDLGIQALRFRSIGQLREELKAIGFSILPVVDGRD